MFNLANTDYRPENFKGYGFYATYDFRYHVGIEGEFHQINDPDATEGIYERTYEMSMSTADLASYKVKRGTAYDA